MQYPIIPDNADAEDVTPASTQPPEDPRYTGIPRPITELVVEPDFPKSALGEYIEIGGLAGVVTEIVNQSLKVRSKDGTMQSFNGNVLRKLYAPAQRPTPSPEPVRSSSSAASSDADEDAEDDTEVAAEVEQPAPGAQVAEANFDGPPKPITELVLLADYPKCLLGAHIEIGGYTGVVVELLDQSMKVKARDGSTQRFNARVLSRVYGPKLKVAERTSRPTYKNPTPAPAADAPPRQVVTDPDFTAPVKQIAEFTTQLNYPQCMYGAHVEINGFTGVVIEIVKGSLKVKSHDGLTRSYNAQVLRKIYV